MPLYVTAVRMSGGDGEPHIASMRWLNTSSGVSKISPIHSMIEWIEKGNKGLVGGENGPAELQVVRPNGRPPYLRSHANGQPSDNLLRLPRF